MCTPIGLDCYNSVGIDDSNCMTPCTGLYADVEKEYGFSKLPKIPNFGSTFARYESYKRGFHKDVNYRNVPSYKKRKSLLRWIRIYFSTPTYDRIIKDEKANFVTKLSAVGGTMGLFAGFSIISGIEMVYFAGKILISFFVRTIRTINNHNTLMRI